MISPTESLAFSMHANPGVYAVLVGSGVSRAAQISTGWEITLDLTRKLAQLRKEPCDPDPAQWYQNAFGKEPDYSDLRMSSLESACSTLLSLGVTGGSWTKEQELIRPWERALDRLGSRDWPESDSEIDLERYPAMLLLHALGLGAVEAGTLSSLGRLLETRIRTSHQEEENAALALHPVTLSRSDLVARSTFGKRLRECLRPHARRIVPDDTRYEMIFDRLEILLGLAYCCRGGRPETMQSGCDPFWNLPGNVERLLNEIEASLSSEGDQSPFVTSRVFGGTEEECRRRIEELRATVRRRG